jgi:type IV pilus assembly protein PilC
MDIPERQQRLARFWKKYLRLTRGRVTALRALHLAAEEEKDPAFKAALVAIHEKIESGTSFSDAIREHPADFSPSIVELVRTAEKSGAWDEILVEIADGLADGTFD